MTKHVVQCVKYVPLADFQSWTEYNELYDHWGSEYQLGIMFSFILINYVADVWVEVWHKAALDGFL